MPLFLGWRSQSLGDINVKNNVVMTQLSQLASVQVPVGLRGNRHDVLTLKLRQTADIIDQLCSPLLSQ